MLCHKPSTDGFSEIYAARILGMVGHPCRYHDSQATQPSAPACGDGAYVVPFPHEDESQG